MSTVTQKLSDRVEQLYVAGRLTDSEFRVAQRIRKHWHKPTGRTPEYIRWARSQDAEVILGGVRVSRLQITIDVVIQNHGVGQVEGWYRLRPGKAVENLKAALGEYPITEAW